MKKQKFSLFIVTLAGTILISSCQAASQKEATPTASTNTPSVSGIPSQKQETSYDENTIMYSNLNDTDAQNEVVNIMQKHGIPKERTDTFIEWVNDFNQRVRSHLADGFVEMPKTDIDYNDIVYESKEADDGSILPEANCRLTSFLLLMDKIQTNKIFDNTDTYIMFDVEAIEYDEQFKTHRTKIDDYQCLYNWIPMNKSAKLEEHMDTVKKAWEDREIKVDVSNNVSIITVPMHTIFEDVRIVGHTGVLFDEGDRLLFVEKYGPDAPFVAIWFHNRTELKEYVLSRKDLYGDKEEVAPFVMENGQVMKTD